MLNNMIKFFLAAFLVSGCASSIVVKPLEAPAIAQKIERNYQLGVVKETYVGDTMIRINTNSVYNNVAVPTMNFRLAQIFGGVSGEKGRQYQVIGRTVVDGVEYNVVELDPYGGLGPHFYGQFLGQTQFAALVSSDGRIHDHLVSYHNLSGMKYEHEVYRLVPSNARMEFRSDHAGQNVDLGKDNFEIVYSGVSGSVINLVYREYTLDDMARQVFHQDISYDMGQPRIRFRNMIINVVFADNEKVVFIVESD